VEIQGSFRTSKQRKLSSSHITCWQDQATLSRLEKGATTAVAGTVFVAIFGEAARFWEIAPTGGEESKVVLMEPQKTRRVG
jgi:hypothetical protein